MCAESDQWISRGRAGDDRGGPGPCRRVFPRFLFRSGNCGRQCDRRARLGAKAASPPLAVRGAQMVGGNVRLTAQVIDAKSGDTLSTASVTGPVNDLLKLEDDLSWPNCCGVPAAPGSGTPAYSRAAWLRRAATTLPCTDHRPWQPAAPPQIIVISQPSQPAYPDYSGYGGYPYGSPYGYGYGGYGWGLYGGFYPGVIYIQFHGQSSRPPSRSWTVALEAVPCRLRKFPAARDPTRCPFRTA